MPTFLELIKKNPSISSAKELKNGQNINQTDEAGFSVLALYLQEERPKKEIVEFLIKKNAGLLAVKKLGSPAQETQPSQYPLFVSLVTNSYFEEVFKEAIKRQKSDLFKLLKDYNLFQWLFLKLDSDLLSATQDPQFNSEKLKSVKKVFEKIVILYNSQISSIERKELNFLSLIEKKDRFQESPIDLACKFGYKDLLELFIRELSNHKGTNLAIEVVNLIENQPSSQNQTLLHLACRHALSKNKAARDSSANQTSSINVKDLDALYYLLDIILKNCRDKASSLFAIRDSNNKSFIDYAFEENDVNVIDCIHHKTHEIHGENIYEWIYNTRGIDALLEYMDKKNIKTLSIKLRSQIAKACQKDPEAIEKLYEKKLLPGENDGVGENFFDVIIKESINKKENLEGILQVVLAIIEKKSDKDLLDKLMQSFVNLAIINEDVGNFIAQTKFPILAEAYSLQIKKINSDKKGLELIALIEKNCPDSIQRALELIKDSETNINLHKQEYNFINFPFLQVILKKNTELFNAILEREDLNLKKDNRISVFVHSIGLNFTDAIKYFTKNRPLETLKDLVEVEVVEENMTKLADAYIGISSGKSLTDVDKDFYQKKLASLKFILDNLPEDFDIKAALFGESQETMLGYYCREFEMVGLVVIEEIVIRYPEIIDRPNNKGESPLYLAAVAGNKELVSLLIKYNAQFNDIVADKELIGDNQKTLSKKAGIIIKKAQEIESKKTPPASVAGNPMALRAACGRGL